MNSGLPGLVSVKQEYQTVHGLPTWVQAPKVHSLASSGITRVITAVTWFLFFNSQCIGHIDTGKGAII